MFKTNWKDDISGFRFLFFFQKLNMQTNRKILWNDRCLIKLAIMQYPNLSNQVKKSVRRQKFDIVHLKMKPSQLSYVHLNWNRPYCKYCNSKQRTKKQTAFSFEQIQPSALCIVWLHGVYYLLSKQIQTQWLKALLITGPFPSDIIILYVVVVSVATAAIVCTHMKYCSAANKSQTIAH